MLNKGFTLLELIVVIIILGILATLGFTQYTTIVEKGRLAEAIVNIGYMRKRATEYYLKNGSMNGLQNSDVDVDNTCSGDSYFAYRQQGAVGGFVNLCASRCTAGGKSPNISSSDQYTIMLYCYPGGITPESWHCARDSSGCYGYPWG